MGVSLIISHKRAAPHEHLLFGKNLTEAQFDTQIRETFLGQAHIAGTGPTGTTCRECVYWRKVGRRRDKPGGAVVEYVKPAEYFGKKHKTAPLALKKQYCTKPILNKAKRMILHSAKSCRLFEPSDNPPAEKRSEQ